MFTIQNNHEFKVREYVKNIMNIRIRDLITCRSVVMDLSENLQRKCRGHDNISAATFAESIKEEKMAN